MERWVLAVVWATLPISAGGALDDAVQDWGTAPRVVAAVLCWSAWAVALLAIVVPRPVGLTAVRAIAPCFAVLAIAAALFADVDLPSAIAAVVVTLVAAVLAARPALAFAAANAAAYGDEARYPLRVPPALFLGPLPAARLVLGAAIVTGPLLLADGRWVAGAVAVVIGAPVAALAARSLHGLSARWAVLVPAGFVVVDPLTLSDPVLFLRERIRAIRPIGAAPPPGGDVLDLRLGATRGSLMLGFDRPAEVFRAVRARKGSSMTRAMEVCVAAVAADRLLTEAATRRLPVITPEARATRAARGETRDQPATPPPSSSSSS